MAEGYLALVKSEPADDSRDGDEAMRSTMPAAPSPGHDLSQTPTPVDRWRCRRDGAADWSVPPVRTVVVAPHPDDEVLMFAGLIAHQVDAGANVLILAVTDGEAAYPDVPPSVLGERRRGEQLAAVEAMGDGRIDIVRLGLPDGGVEEHSTALAGAIQDVRSPGCIIAAPWHLDHHCDHEAIGRAALDVALRSGDRLVQGIFWGWHHRSPTDLEQPLRRLRLSTETMKRRQTALNCHRSQVGAGHRSPVLDASALEPLAWPFEYHIVLPTQREEQA